MDNQTEEKKLSREEMIKKAWDIKEEKKKNTKYKTETDEKEVEEMVKKGIID